MVATHLINSLLSMSYFFSRFIHYSLWSSFWQMDY